MVLKARVKVRHDSVQDSQEGSDYSLFDLLAERVAHRQQGQIGDRSVATNLKLVGTRHERVFHTNKTITHADIPINSAKVQNHWEAMQLLVYNVRRRCMPLAWCKTHSQDHGLPRQQTSCQLSNNSVMSRWSGTNRFQWVKVYATTSTQAPATLAQDLFAT